MSNRTEPQIQSLLGKDPTNFVRILVGEVKDAIIKKPNLKINDLYKSLLNFIFPQHTPPNKQPALKQNSTNNVENTGNKSQQTTKDKENQKKK